MLRASRLPTLAEYRLLRYLSERPSLVYPAEEAQPNFRACAAEGWLAHHPSSPYRAWWRTPTGTAAALYYEDTVVEGGASV